MIFQLVEGTVYPKQWANMMLGMSAIASIQVRS